MLECTHPTPRLPLFHRTHKILLRFELCMTHDGNVYVYYTLKVFEYYAPKSQKAEHYRNTACGNF